MLYNFCIYKIGSDCLDKVSSAYGIISYTMDFLGVLEDDELSHLSERMTPVEFDRIALQYLKLKKVCRYGIIFCS